MPGPALVFVLPTPIPSVQNNPSFSSSSFLISYKSFSFLPSLMPKLFSVRVEEINNNIDTDVEM